MLSEGELVPTPEEAAIQERQDKALIQQELATERQDKALIQQELEQLKSRLKALGIDDVK